MSRRLLITDHAVDRYIERIERMGVERARERIRERWDVGQMTLLGTRSSGEREWRSEFDPVLACVFVTKMDRGLTVVVTTLDDSKAMRGDSRVEFEREAFEAAQRLEGEVITDESIGLERGGEWVLPAAVADLIPPRLSTPVRFNPQSVLPAYRLRNALRSILPYVREKAMAGDHAACRAMEDIPDEVLDEVLGKDRS